jgi:hypothetical protein
MALSQSQLSIALVVPSTPEVYVGDLQLKLPQAKLQGPIQIITKAKKGQWNGSGG